jgi:hypothetical protein
MALPPLELFSLKGKAALLPGGFFVYLRDLRQLRRVNFDSAKHMSAFTEFEDTSKSRLALRAISATIQSTSNDHSAYQARPT